MKSLRTAHQLLIALGVVIFCITVFVSGAAHDSQTATQDQSSGPAVGETIDLLAFRSQSGLTLAETIKGHSLAMIVFVNPNCIACTSAKDTFRNLRERVAQPGIPYYVLMVPQDADAQKYFAYADSLKLEAKAFIWSTPDSKPPSTLVNMALPSHLLITGEGLIVNKWLGTPESSSN